MDKLEKIKKVNVTEDEIMKAKEDIQF